jgi:hypothetical protein
LNNYYYSWILIPQHCFVCAQDKVNHRPAWAEAVVALEMVRYGTLPITSLNWQADRQLALLKSLYRQECFENLFAGIYHFCKRFSTQTLYTFAKGSALKQQALSFTLNTSLVAFKNVDSPFFNVTPHVTLSAANSK